MLWCLCALAGAAHAADDPFKSSGAGKSLVVGHDAFLPVEQAYRLQVTLRDGQPLLTWQIADGYYLYRHALAFKDGGAELAAQIPAGKVKEDEFFGRVEVYYHNLDVTLAAPAQAFTLAATYQGCADAGLCYPPRTEYFRVDPVAGTAQPEAAPAAGLPGAAAAVAGAADGSAATWLGMLLFAVVGGAILNLMPCVFPVLSLKVLSFASHGGRRQPLHGLSYMAGVIGSFLLVAVALLALQAAGRAVGWGFQLQQPWFVGGLAYLFFAMGLSLSGFWELGGQWMGAGSGLTTGSGYRGSFFTGVLATVVASPCTAPFMGSALGFAATQPPAQALAIFAALGFGMALPVLLLCLSPRLLAFIPKPGAWMERFKQALAFPLYATAIWLCWVVGRQTGATGMAVILGGALALTLALWLWRFGSVARGIAAAALALAIALLANPLLTDAPTPASATAGAVAGDWRPYRAETLADLRAAGTPVFLNVTADWCITCLANEKVTLSNAAVKTAFAAGGVAYMKGDWTHYDPALTALLGEFGRNGVPLYVFFPAQGDRTPVILPQLLTPAAVIEAVGTAKARS